MKMRLKLLFAIVITCVLLSTDFHVAWAHDTSEDDDHQEVMPMAPLPSQVGETLANAWQVNDVGIGTKPSFDFDAQGRVHVMGITEREDPDGVVWYARGNSAAGPFTNEVVSTGYYYGPGDIRVDPSGTAHLAWHNHDDEDPNSLTVSPNGATRLFRIPSPGHNGWDNALALDRQGNVYQSSVNPNGITPNVTSSLEFSTFDGNAWNLQTVPGTGPFMYGLNTSLAIDNANEAHILYCNCQNFSTPGTLNYARQEQGQWTVSTVQDEGISGRFPVLALDSADRPHAAWIDIDSNDTSRGFVRYGVLNNGTWEIQTVDTLDDISLGFFGARKSVSIELDSNGTPHVAYGDRRFVKYAVLEGNDWDRQTLLESDTARYNGLVVLRLDSADDAPAIVFWQPENTSGSVRLLSPIFEGLNPGDANRDGQFDQRDLFQVLRNRRFGNGQPATWEDGDWNGGPGGREARPPIGDGVFDNQDIIAALASGLWLAGPQGGTAATTAAARFSLSPTENSVSVIYNSETGEVEIDVVGAPLTRLEISSEDGIFNGVAAGNLQGALDEHTTENLFKATPEDSFGSLSFGYVAATGLDEEFLLDDLQLRGSLANGSGLENVRIVVVPEPSALSAILAMFTGLLVLSHRSRRWLKNRSA